MQKLGGRLFSEVQLKKDAADNFQEELPLSLKLEKYQRKKLLHGLGPKKDDLQRDSLINLISLKYVQRFEDQVDDFRMQLRDRNYSEYMRDPLGKKQKEKI